MNRKQIENWKERFNYLWTEGQDRNELNELCDLALCALQPQDEPVTWWEIHVPQKDQAYVVDSLDDQRAMDDLTNHRAVARPLTYADAPPADGVVVPSVTDEPCGQCSVCMRKAWSERELGCICNFLQPNGTRCSGTMLAAAPKGGE